VFKDWFALAEEQLVGGTLSRADARAILAAPDGDMAELVAAGGHLRRAYFGNWVKADYLVNLKSGLCSEDCNDCSQHLGSEAGGREYRWLSQEEALRQAKAGIRGGAARICMSPAVVGRAPAMSSVWRRWWTR
jgi:biotin synthase